MERGREGVRSRGGVFLVGCALTVCLTWPPSPACAEDEAKRLQVETDPAEAGLTPIFSDGFESGDYFAWSRVEVDSPDDTPPTLAITAPVEPLLFNQHVVPIEIVYSDDDSGIALASVRVEVDGIPLSFGCEVLAGSASCESFYLDAGSHTLEASVWDQAGNRADAQRDVLVIVDTEGPEITLTAPPVGISRFNTPTILLAGTATDADMVASVVVSVQPVSLDDGPLGKAFAERTLRAVEGESFMTEIGLAEGLNFFLVRATDRAGNESVVSAFVELDTVLPVLAVEAPTDGATVNTPTVHLAGTAFDDAGAVTLTVEGVPVTLAGRRFELDVALSEGVNDLLLEATDEAGNVTATTFQVHRLTVPTLAITSPEYGAAVSGSTVEVLGTVSDPAATVVVNGLAATVGGGTFSAPAVPVGEGGTLITVAATSLSGAQATAKSKVFRDASPPRLTITSPADGSTVHSPTVSVLGLVNDVVPGTVNATQVSVTVNGQPAEVANRAFLVSGVSLLTGANQITVTAEDAAGNLVSAEIAVTYEAPSGRRIEVVSGDLQQGVIGSALGAPLVVRLLDEEDSPVAGEPVVFRVVQGNGELAGVSRSVTVATDGAGEARSSFRLGTRAGVGNHRVEVSAVGFAGPARFVASAVPGPPAYLHVDAGGQQRGAAYQLLADPIAVVVTDVGFNRLEGEMLRLQVVAGGAVFEDGAVQQLMLASDDDGRGAARLRLGPDEGIADTVVEVTLPDDPAIPKATFVASTLAAGDPAATQVSGLVIDNADQPVPGVTMRLLGTGLSARSDAEGLFTIAAVPVGTFLLEADGHTATRPGAWPHLEFELTTIPGRDNTLGMPIRLLPLDTERGLAVSATAGGTLTLPELPGFSITVPPGSVTFPDGGSEGVVSATLVHGDKVPMVPNFGQQPTFIVTIQPAGALFDPPAAITLPNVDGLAPGEVTELYSFDHDLGSFVSIGPGTVTADATAIASDPGVGILKAGWHCGGNPATTGTPHDCPQCKVCDGSRCVPGCDLLHADALGIITK